MDEEVHKRIQRLQGIEENLHSYLQQKQQVQSQLMELESARDALGDAKTAFRIIGNIMVEQPSENVAKDVNDRIERARIRIDSITKQEDRLKKEAEELQKFVMENMKK